jgi:DNA-binding IclR family transcriptional regulator
VSGIGDMSRLEQNRERFGSTDERIERIADMLRIRFAGSARVVELAEATGLPPTVVGSALGEMAKRGLAHRDGRTWIEGAA